MENIRVVTGSVTASDAAYGSLPRTLSQPLGTATEMPTQPKLKVTSAPDAFPVEIDIADLQAQCVRDGIKLIRQCFLNNSGELLELGANSGVSISYHQPFSQSGTLATYIVPTSVFFRRHAVKGRGMVPGLQVLPIGQDDLVWDFVHSGGIDLSKEVDFKPDWTTFRYLPHAPGHAFCLGLTYSRGELRKGVSNTGQIGEQLLIDYDSIFD